jgi:hypothetical protein
MTTTTSTTTTVHGKCAKRVATQFEVLPPLCRESRNTFRLHSTTTRFVYHHFCREDNILRSITTTFSIIHHHFCRESTPVATFFDRLPPLGRAKESSHPSPRQSPPEPPSGRHEHISANHHLLRPLRSFSELRRDIR